MIPVTQTKMVVRNAAGEIVVRGNCMAAAIASIMEIPITEVPNIEVLFHIDNYWWEVMHTWLNSLGWELRTDNKYEVFHRDNGIDNSFLEEVVDFFELKDNYYLASGPSSRGVNHVCIYKAGKLVHDPHPSRDGLLSVNEFETLEYTGIKSAYSITKDPLSL